MNFDPSRFNPTMKGFTSSKGSFPIGGGDCGANVWVSDDGRLNLLLSKTDCFSEASRLMKLGFLQFSCASPVFSENDLPCSTLRLENGCAVITDNKNKVRVKVAAVVGRPLFAVDFSFGEENEVEVSLFNYRSEKRKIIKGDDSARSYSSAPFDIYESADVINTENPNCLSWYHHNGWSYYDYTVKNQHLKENTEDLLLHRTFGCSVTGKGFALNGKKLRSRKAKNHTVYIAAGCEITDNPEEWSRRQAEKLIKESETYDFGNIEKENSGWWSRYFGDFFLEFSGDADAEAVTRGYTYQKYLLGCASRGNEPIKFNGSIFTAEPSPDDENDYDYRKWGDAFWIQNTRLIYWDMLYSGHFEGMIPFFDFICRIMPVCRERCRVLFGHDGLLLPETIMFTGAYEDIDFGYGQEDSDHPECINNYIRWHYNGALEVSYMMLKFKDYTEGRYDGYFRDKLLPFIEGVLLFFREHFPAVDGKMRLQPVSALETWQDCVDDTPDIAGLLAVIRGLKQIGITPCIDEDYLPCIPITEKQGKKVIASCRFSFRPEQQNCENPELYTMFPFDIFRHDMNDSDKTLLTDTFALVPNKHVSGWSQMNIWAAMLGDSEYCRKNVADNFRAVNKDYFFGAYFGPNFDWTPDQDHGCSSSVAALYMAIQSAGRKVFLKPAVPDGWKVRFRLPTSCGICEYGDE